MSYSWLILNPTGLIGRMKFWAASVCFVILCSVGRILLAAEEAPPKKATYVGSEICKACHAPQFEKFSKTVMGKIFLFNSRNELEKKACESCHGPASNHVAAGGGKGAAGMISYRKDSGESTEMQNQSCLQCHERGPQTFWAASTHAMRGLACTSCHTVMEKTTSRFQLSKRDDRTNFFIKRAKTAVCTQCHPTKKAQFYRSSHMPQREGKITCTDCHNPHGTPNPAMIKQGSVNENCYACHPERRGPFLWEHPPVLESCSNCHEPHGTVNDFLLKVRQPRLCQQCHLGVRHPGNPQNPTSVFVFNRSCTNCHPQIHGSNHPSGLRFQR